MKYIRTKDKIYGGNSNLEMAVEYFEETLKEKVIKTANTIEELCDEFICEKQLARGFKYKGAVSYFRALRLTSDIYGAIWTDKGLIYVAKMNDKGELELL